MKQPSRILSPLAGAILLLLSLSHPAVHSADAVDVRDLPPDFSKTNESHEAWARRLQQEYSQTNDQLRRIMARRITVPPPDTSGSMRSKPIYIPIKAPWDFLSPLPDISIGIQPLGEPRVKVTAELGGSALYVSKTMLASCQLTDDNPIWQTKSEFKADFPEWSEGILADPIGHLSLNFSLSGGRLNEVSGSFEVSVVSLALGVRPAGDYGDMAFETFASAGTGIATPSSIKRLFSLSAKVDVEISALVTLTDPVFGSPYGRQTLNGAIVKKVEAIMRVAFDCPTCNAAGELTCQTCYNKRTVTCSKCNDRRSITCPTCSDRRTVTCTSCNGERNFHCTSCGGVGWRSCPTTEKCYTCSGTGWDDCMWCSGSGTKREEHSETRWRSVPRRIGFDENGDPIEEYYDEPYTYTWYTTITCSSCSGAGGQTCGSCGGDGTAVCSDCGGSGQSGCRSCDGDGRVDCRKCDGTGNMRCPKCRGKPIRCPQCKGKPLRCPECKGKSLKCPFCKGKKRWGGSQ